MPEFEAEVADRLDRDARGLGLNLQDVTYLSSASLRVFLALSRQAARQGGQFALAGVQPYCREVLRISGLATVAAGVCHGGGGAGGAGAGA